MTRRLSVEAICRSIESLLPGGCPLIEQVARSLHVTPRTLQRLLDDEGVSFSQLVDACRCQTACDSLEYTRDSVREIAAFLGYRDVGSFSRAFRSWTGKAPHAYRNYLGQPES